MTPKKKTTQTPKPAAPKAVAAPKPAARKATARKKRAIPEVVAGNQPTVTVTDDDIRIRAYFLSLEYRGSNRNDVDFWLLAERELRGK